MEEKKRSIWKKVGLISGLIVGLLMLITYGVIAIYFSDHYFYHTVINGKDYSFRTPLEVEEGFKNDLKNYSLEISGRAGAMDTILPPDIKLEYKPDETAKLILEEQIGILWISGYLFPHDYEVPVSVQYDNSLMTEQMNDLVFYKEEFIKKPHKASLIFEEETGSYRLEPGSAGTELNRKKTDEAIQNAVRNLDSKLDLEEADCYLYQEEEEDLANLNKVLGEANQFLAARIEYDWFGNEVVVDAPVIKDWILLEEEHATLDEAKIEDFVTAQSKSYDTYGRNRKFKTTDGRELELKSGGYGWKTNREEETKLLIELIRQGQQEKRFPEYTFKANYAGENDIGSSYVEIDLGRQHLYLYVEGELIVESDFVSGNVSRGWTTPPGVFGLTYKTRNAVLRGENYETPVSYWMPFNGNIGMHDAGWRASFGGEIYMNGGSHGCVNLPPENAKIIYEYLYTGFPVICYY